jgi:RNA polymerase sigma-70 factor (ECF subfamily)
MTESTSITLLIRLKEEGPAREIAWREFDRRYAPVIASFCRRLGAGTQEIDEVVRDVISGFYAAQPRFEYNPANGRLRGYLKTCVVHALSARAKKRLKVDGRPIEEIDPQEPELDQPWAESWERERLLRAVEEVREQTGDSAGFRAFHRIAIAGDDPEKVAADLGMSIDSVYKAKSRCMARLKSVISQLESEEG